MDVLSHITLVLLGIPQICNNILSFFGLFAFSLFFLKMKIFNFQICIFLFFVLFISRGPCWSAKIYYFFRYFLFFPVFLF